MKYVMGIGNYSMFDDSIGIKVIEYLSEKKLDVGFEAIDLSGNLLNIFSYLNNETKKILLVDSGHFDLKPGEYIFFKPEEVMSEKELTNITSHEGDILKVLKLAQETNYPIPEIMIMGIEPKKIEIGFGLSEQLENNIPKYADEIIEFMSGTNTDTIN